MPRLRKEAQAGRFAKGRKHGNQWPVPSVWGSGPNADRASERWFMARRPCDVVKCVTCALDRRLTRMRSAYGRRKQ